MTAPELTRHQQMKLDSRPPTVAAMFQRRVENTPDKVAFKFPDVD